MHELTISKDDAIVLFEFFWRFEETGRLGFVHPAEYIVLQKLSAQIDKMTSVPFNNPNYSWNIEAARNRVAAGFEGDYPGRLPAAPTA